MQEKLEKYINLPCNNSYANLIWAFQKFVLTLSKICCYFRKLFNANHFFLSHLIQNPIQNCYFIVNRIAPIIQNPVNKS